MIPEDHAFIGIGSNLKDPVRQVRAALDRLGRLPGCRWLKRSSLYRTAPWGRSGQPDFINAVAVVSVDLAPEELLEYLQRIEREAGRVREGERWGPRVLDLDLLLYGNRVQTSPRLTLPHPRLHERAFALAPLVELAPDVEIPGRGPAAGLLRALGRQGVELLGNAG